jgi:hypothetical protein
MNDREGTQQQFPKRDFKPERGRSTDSTSRSHSPTPDFAAGKTPGHGGSPSRSLEHHRNEYRKLPPVPRGNHGDSGNEGHVEPQDAIIAKHPDGPQATVESHTDTNQLQNDINQRSVDIKNIKKEILEAKKYKNDCNISTRGFGDIIKIYIQNYGENEKDNYLKQLKTTHGNLSKQLELSKEKIKNLEKQLKQQEALKEKLLKRQEALKVEQQPSIPISDIAPVSASPSEILSLDTDATLVSPPSKLSQSRLIVGPRTLLGGRSLTDPDQPLSKPRRGPRTLKRPQRGGSHSEPLSRSQGDIRSTSDAILPPPAAKHPQIMPELGPQIPTDPLRTQTQDIPTASNLQKSPKRTTSPELILPSDRGRTTGVTLLPPETDPSQVMPVVEGATDASSALSKSSGQPPRKPLGARDLVRPSRTAPALTSSSETKAPDKDATLSSPAKVRSHTAPVSGSQGYTGPTTDAPRVFTISPSLSDTTLAPMSPSDIDPDAPPVPLKSLEYPKALPPIPPSDSFRSHSPEQSNTAAGFRTELSGTQGHIERRPEEIATTVDMLSKYYERLNNVVSKQRAEVARLEKKKAKTDKLAAAREELQKLEKTLEITKERLAESRKQQRQLSEPLLD